TQGRGDRSSDRHRLPLKFESAGQHASPQIEPLLDVGDVRDPGLRAVGFRQPERDAAKMEPVRILAQPVVKLVLPFGADRVTDLTAIGVELYQAQRLRIEPRRQRRAMPSPLGDPAERRPLLIPFRKSLQPSHVRVYREFAVADRQRRQRIELSQHWAVTLNERHAVNRRKWRRMRYWPRQGSNM